MRSTWKIKNLLSIEDFKKKDQNIFYTKKRNIFILKDYVGSFFYIYNGKKFNKIYINSNMIGKSLFGNYIFTKKFLNIHKKQKKKKKKKK